MVIDDTASDGMQVEPTVGTVPAVDVPCYNPSMTMKVSNIRLAASAFARIGLGSQFLA